MNTQETAIKYGVPMPETCKELNWQIQTLFAWIKKEGEWILINYNDWCDFGYPIYICAPQMHEIAPLLPFDKDIQPLQGYYKWRFSINRNWFKKEKNADIELSYSAQKIDKTFVNQDKNITIKSVNNHYAQAYAEMYLKLKKENLI